MLVWVLFVLFLFYGKYPGNSINFCICVALKVQAGSNTWGHPSNSPPAHGSPPCQCCVLSIPWGRRRAAQAFDGTLLTFGPSPALCAAGWCAPWTPWGKLCVPQSSPCLRGRKQGECLCQQVSPPSGTKLSWVVGFCAMPCVWPAWCSAQQQEHCGSSRVQSGPAAHLALVSL